jgi:hypothetical protein
MRNPGSVAILNHCIAELEEYKQHEDALEDPELRLICGAMDYLKDIRKKVIQAAADDHFYA